MNSTEQAKVKFLYFECEGGTGVVQESLRGLANIFTTPKNGSTAEHAEIAEEAFPAPGIEPQIAQMAQIRQPEQARIPQAAKSVKSADDRRCANPECGASLAGKSPTAAVSICQRCWWSSWPAASLAAAMSV